jgi:hypothetical protein
MARAESRVEQQVPQLRTFQGLRRERGHEPTLYDGEQYALQGLTSHVRRARRARRTEARPRSAMSE